MVVERKKLGKENNTDNINDIHSINNIDRQTNINKQTDMQTDRQTDRYTQTDTEMMDERIGNWSFKSFFYSLLVKQLWKSIEYFLPGAVPRQNQFKYSAPVPLSSIQDKGVSIAVPATEAMSFN